MSTGSFCACNKNVGGVLLVTELCRHHQDWVKDACGDVWLGFEPADAGPLRNARLLASCGLNPKYTVPKARSVVRMASTIPLNSCGSIENSLSGPFRDRDKVRCFSMIQAPSVTAATATALPIV